MVDFCDINKGLGTIICFFLVVITFQGCSNASDKVEAEVLAHQAAIDSLIAAVILPIKSDIDSQIVEYNTANKDTFQLARKRIPITKIQFLISNEYFTLDSLLIAYQNDKIPAKSLKAHLEISQQRVDSLINSEAIKDFSE